MKRKLSTLVAIPLFTRPVFTSDAKLFFKEIIITNTNNSASVYKSKDITCCTQIRSARYNTNECINLDCYQNPHTFSKEQAQAHPQLQPMQTGVQYTGKYEYYLPYYFNVSLARHVKLSEASNHLSLFILISELLSAKSDYFDEIRSIKSETLLNGNDYSGIIHEYKSRLLHITGR